MPRRWLAPDFFTDEKMKKSTVPERLLAAALIANQDDDGRLRGDPAYLRAIAFLYDDYPLDEVKTMRDHLTQVNPNILVYQNGGEEYIQLKRYSRYQKPRYYHPSRYPVPPGWPFQEGNQVVTTPQPPSDQVVTLGKGKGKNLDLDQNKGEGEGPKQHPSPSATALPLEQKKLELDIYQKFIDCMPFSFGKQPDSRDLSQIRDYSKEFAAARASPQMVFDAFKEAANHKKMHLSYVRAVLLDWLGVERNRSP